MATDGFGVQTLKYYEVKGNKIVYYIQILSLQQEVS